MIVLNIFKIYCTKTHNEKISNTLHTDTCQWPWLSRLIVFNADIDVGWCGSWQNIHLTEICWWCISQQLHPYHWHRFSWKSNRLWKSESQTTNLGYSWTGQVVFQNIECILWSLWMSFLPNIKMIIKCKFAIIDSVPSFARIIEELQELFWPMMLQMKERFET